MLIPAPSGRNLVVAGFLCFAVVLLPGPSPAGAADNSISPREPTGKKWVDMDYGPYLSMSFEAPDPPGNIAYKGLVIAVDRDADAYVLFDTDLLRWAAGWLGGPIDWRSVVYDGSHHSHPWIVGDQQFGNAARPGWGHKGDFTDPRTLPYGPLPHDRARYKGLFLHGDRVVLSYTVGDSQILESPGLEKQGRQRVFTRTLEVGPSAVDRVVQLAERKGLPGTILGLNDLKPSQPAASAGSRVAVLGTIKPKAKPQTDARPEPVIPTDGLVARWLFDEGKGATAVSTADKQIAVLHKATWTAGKYGTAIRVEGGSHVLVKRLPGLKWGGTDYSVAAWVKTSTGGTIVSLTKTGAWVPGGKTLFVRDGRLAFDIGWVGVVTSSRRVADGRWHHVAMTHSAQDGIVRLYVDGVPDGHKQLRSVPDPDGSRLRFGVTSKNFPARGSNRLRGALDEVTITNRLLSAKEIKAMAPNAGSADEEITAVGVRAAPPDWKWEVTNDSCIRLHIPANRKTERVKLLIWRGPSEDLPKFADLVRTSDAPDDLGRLTHGGPTRFPQNLTTTGKLGDGKSAYTVDTITAPDENPWHSWMRFGGFDFFASGKRAAICTWSGDVWIVSGLDGDLEKLVWKRIATGLFQPLGLKIVDERIYVCCRDQITRLVDLNGDDETDFYESFNNDHQVTEHFHEFAMDLQTDAEGNFYYAKSARHALDSVVPQHGTLLKVSKDGKTTEIVCNGFRAANGVGVGPHGELVNTDQEGHWTPANRINLVKPGGFYGNMYSYHRGPRPTGYDPPLCWLPTNVDRSPAEPLWVTSDQWGPLEGSMISTSYGTGQIFLVPYEYVDGVPQGGAVKFPLSFPTGIMRSRFHPGNGQLYVCGLFGWSSDKTQPGGFYRVRYTGRPVYMPVKFHAAEDGIELGFTEPLDRESAEDVNNYNVREWNYRWTANYGSAHYLLSDPRREGADRVDVLAAKLAEDGKTVFLRLKDLRPVMQMEISYTLRAVDGAAVRQDFFSTLNKLGRRRGASIPTVASTRPNMLTGEQQANLRPGLLLHGEQAAGKQVAQDVRVSRLAALHVPAGTAPTPFLKTGPFAARFDGYVKLELGGDFAFSLKGNGRAALRINGTEVLSAKDDLSQADGSTVSLPQGYNRIELTYHSPAAGAATVRLYWASDEFSTEPIPPSQLFHDGANRQLNKAMRLRMGRELFATRSCAKCHGLPAGLTGRDLKMPEMSTNNPHLADVGRRLTEDWMARWILNPETLRNNVTMPRLLHADTDADRQKAADLAAYLAGLGRKKGTGPICRNGPQGALHKLDLSPVFAQLPGKQEIAQGEILYENLGCIACHRSTKPDKEDEFDRTSLCFVHWKYSEGALSDFLKKPQQHYAHIRMPDFLLKTEEARLLAAYLRSTSSSELPSGPVPDRGDPDRGKELFGRIGCANCHSVTAGSTDTRSELAIVRIKRTNRGCLAGRKKGTGPICRNGPQGALHKLDLSPFFADAPDFRFSEEQRQALAAFWGTDGSSLTRYTPAEASERAMTLLNCTACHKRDSTNNDWPILLAEEGSQGKLPEIVPSLTFVGERLKAGWIESFLDGSLSYRPRPFLKARMPVFSARAGILAAGLSAEHGFPTETRSPRHAPPSRQTVEIGRRLTLKDKGFNCVQCHDVGTTKATAPFDSLSVNFTLVTARMRYDFYPRWMLNPPRIDPATKMPVLAPDHRRTSLTHVYDGDAKKQFEAIWYYLESIEAEP